MKKIKVKIIEDSKKERRLKKVGIDPDLVTGDRSIKQLSKGLYEEEDIKVLNDPDNTEYTALQKKYLQIIQSLDPEELKKIKAMFCYNEYSVEELNRIHKSMKGTLNKPDK